MFFGLLYAGMQAKATQIEQAMSRIPLAERKHLLSSTQTLELMDALATNRGDKTGKKHLDAQGHIDIENAARTFKKFIAGMKPERLKELEQPKEIGQVPSTTVRGP